MNSFWDYIMARRVSIGLNIAFTNKPNCLAFNETDKYDLLVEIGDKTLKSWLLRCLVIKMFKIKVNIRHKGGESKIIKI